MGLTWAIAWALVGLTIGVASKLTPGLPFWDSFFRVFDAPLPALALPGFVGGGLFSIVLGIAARNRRFEELSIPRFALLGALGGVLLSIVPDAMVAVGLANINGPHGIGYVTSLIIGPLTVLSSASAAATLALARKVERRESVSDGATERV